MTVGTLTRKIGQVPARTEVKNRTKRKSFALLVAGAIAVLLGTAIAAPLTFGGIRLKRVSFPNGFIDGKPRVAATLYAPRSLPGERKVPAVVFAHGFTANKDVYLPMCRELARKGVVVLGVDLPGHGGSGGTSDIGGTEYTALLAGYDWLVRNVREVDIGKVAAAGHSLGGLSATRAGLSQKPERFSAVMAIWCTPDIRESVELLYGSLEKSMLPGLWSLSRYFSKAFDITSDSDLGLRNVKRRVSESAPPNWLLVDGERDQVSSVQLDRRLMCRAIDSNDCVPGVTYGSFEDGTARRLVVTNDDHVFEILSGQVLAAMTDWLDNCYGLDIGGSSAFLFPRYWGLVLILGGALLCGMAAALFCYRFMSERGLAPEGGMRSDYRLSGSGRVLQAGALVFLLMVSLSTLPIAKLTHVKAIVPPFLVGDLVSSIALVQVILMLAGIGAAILISGGSLPDFESLDIRGTLRHEVLWAVPALTGFAAFLAVFAPFARLLSWGRGYPIPGRGSFTWLR